MQNNLHDLTHAGAYLSGAALLFGSIAFAAPAVLKEIPASNLMLNWAAALEPAPPEPTRLSVVVANAREIRASLAKPIPKVEPLPPITAKLAYGYLRPGASGAKAMLAQSAKLPIASLDAMAMAMDTSAAKRFGASSAVAPELHKVY